MASPSSGIWTPANIVTMVRILLIPVFVGVLIAPWPQWTSGYETANLWKPWLAAFVFILLAATDALDGYLARSRNEVTDFGKFMDPLADKILVAAALLALIELDVLPTWAALIILAREFIVSGIRMVAATKGVVIAASWYGKAKTVFQMIAIVLFIVKDSHVLTDFNAVLNDWLYLISWAVMFVALALTIISMLDYFAKAKDVLGFAPAVVEAKELDRAARLVASARERGVKLGTAESCTGGLVAAAISAVPGASEVLEGGIVSYSNDVKHARLGVDTHALREFGAVSTQVAEQMARGACEQLGVDYAVSVTGIAGPGGGSVAKPVGTVCFGIAGPRGATSERLHFDGDREAVRTQSVDHALDLLAAAVSDAGVRA